MDDIAAYVKKLAKRLGLRDWDIEVTLGGVSDNETMAECAAVYGQKRANIRISHDWINWDANTLRSVIAHELIHCHTADIAEIVDAVYAHSLSKDAKAVADSAFELAVEHCVDAIAVAVAPLLPYPHEVFGK